MPDSTQELGCDESLIHYSFIPHQFPECLLCQKPCQLLWIQKSSKTQPLPSSCLHSSLRNRSGTDECKEVIRDSVREANFYLRQRKSGKVVSSNKILSTRSHILTFPKAFGDLVLKAGRVYRVNCSKLIIAAAHGTQTGTEEEANSLLQHESCDTLPLPHGRQQQLALLIVFS